MLPFRLSEPDQRHHSWAGNFPPSHQSLTDVLLTSMQGGASLSLGPARCGRAKEGAASRSIHLVLVGCGVAGG